MALSVEDTYTPEDGISFDAGPLANQIAAMYDTIFLTDGEPVVYVTVGPDRMHVGRVSQMVETLSDGSEVRSIHLELIEA